MYNGCMGAKILKILQSLGIAAADSVGIHLTDGSTFSWTGGEIEKAQSDGDTVYLTVADADPNNTRLTFDATKFDHISR